MYSANRFFSPITAKSRISKDQVELDWGNRFISKEQVPEKNKILLNPANIKSIKLAKYLKLQHVLNKSAENSQSGTPTIFRQKQNINHRPKLSRIPQPQNYNHHVNYSVVDRHKPEVKIINPDRFSTTRAGKVYDYMVEPKCFFLCSKKTENKPQSQNATIHFKKMVPRDVRFRNWLQFQEEFVPRRQELEYKNMSIRLRKLEQGFGYESDKLGKELETYNSKIKQNKFPKEVSIQPQLEGKISPQQFIDSYKQRVQDLYESQFPSSKKNKQTQASRSQSMYIYQ